MGWLYIMCWGPEIWKDVFLINQIHSIWNDCLTHKNFNRTKKLWIKYFWNIFHRPKSFLNIFYEFFFHNFWTQKFLIFVILKSQNLQIPQLSWLRKKFRWPKRSFHIFPTYKKSISINPTISHVHTTRRSEWSAKKLKFDAAT